MRKSPTTETKIIGRASFSSRRSIRLGTTRLSIRAKKGGGNSDPAAQLITQERNSPAEFHFPICCVVFRRENWQSLSFDRKRTRYYGTETEFCGTDNCLGTLDEARHTNVCKKKVEFEFGLDFMCDFFFHQFLVCFYVRTAQKVGTETKSEQNKFYTIKTILRIPNK